MERGEEGFPSEGERGMKRLLFFLPLLLSGCVQVRGDAGGWARWGREVGEGYSDFGKSVAESYSGTYGD